MVPLSYEHNFFPSIYTAKNKKVKATQVRLLQLQPQIFLSSCYYSITICQLLLACMKNGTLIITTGCCPAMFNKHRLRTYYTLSLTRMSQTLVRVLGLGLIRDTMATAVMHIRSYSSIFCMHGSAG